MAENMAVEQLVTADGTGVVITTYLRCGLLYQHKQVIPFESMAKVSDTEGFLKGAKRHSALTVFADFWDKANG